MLKPTFSRVPKFSLLEARINNNLCTRNTPWEIPIGKKKAWLYPEFLVQSNAYTSAISLEVGNDTWYITFQNDAWIYTHPTFDSVVNKENVSFPLELKQALLENFIEIYAQYLSKLLELPVKIKQSYFDLSNEIIIHDQMEEDLSIQFPTQLPHDLLKSHCRFPFKCIMPFLGRDYQSLNTETNDHFELENIDDIYHISIDIFIPQATNIDILLTKLGTLPTQEKSSWTERSIKNIPLEISFETGYVSLNKEELTQLEVGDILLPDEYYSHPSTNQACSKLKLLLGTGDFTSEALCNKTLNSSYNLDKQVFVFCSLEGNQAIVLENIQTNYPQVSIQKNTEENIMTQEANTNTNNEASPEASANNIDITKTINNLEAIVSFELERRILSIEDIQSITKGYTFALASDKDSPVTLRINGKAMGSGRLVDMDGMLGVQITKIGS